MLEHYAPPDVETPYPIVIEAGVDEVARGPLFGPVFAAAVILDKNIPLHKWLNDSKKVTRLRRKEVRKWIEENSVAFSVAHISNDLIDEINIRNCAYLAMELAIRNLSVKPERILVDGDYFPGTVNFGKYDEKITTFVPERLDKDIEHFTVVGGDAIYANIAAASILAKEYHDDYIKSLILADPTLDLRYSLQSNMGYGTAKHILGLKTHGVTPFHRKSFLTRILPEFAVKDPKQVIAKGISAKNGKPFVVKRFMFPKDDEEEDEEEVNEKGCKNENRFNI